MNAREMNNRKTYAGSSPRRNEGRQGSRGIDEFDVQHDVGRYSAATTPHDMNSTWLPGSEGRRGYADEYESLDDYPNDGSSLPVSIATAVPSDRFSGVTSASGPPSRGRVSGPMAPASVASEDYYSDNNPWKDIQKEPQEKDWRRSGYGDYPQESLTDLHGPRGTRGRDPRRMDSTQYSDLIREGYSTGLAHALTENAQRYDFRFWVVDNSGSMQIGDGHRLVAKNGHAKAVACTRWEEIKETVKYHAQMAAVLDCPTIFQLLNDPGLRTIPQKFSVCEHGESQVKADVAKAIQIMNKVSPTGVTPLTNHIWTIADHISGMAAELRRSGKIVAIILATDGLPTDDQGYGGEDITDEFIRSLRALEGLPIWTVIRLCTDEDEVKEFYNSLDSQLEISLEVLDDYMGEAQEVYKQNPWITYALPLHRCRELGYHDRLFDLIDERPLTAGEARSFCCFILGLNEQELPDPGADASAFLKSVKKYLEQEQMQWNPIKKKMTPWILTKELKKSFSNRTCVIM